MNVKKTKSFKLTIKQEKFILKYFECGNATEAYKHAYNAENMKDKTINERASRLLKEGKVSARLKSLISKAEKRTEVTVDNLVNELAKVAFMDIGKYLDISNEGVIINNLDNIDKSVIAGATEVFNKDGIRVGVELKFHDKLNAIEKLMRHKGAYKQNIEITSEIDLGDIAKKIFNDRKEDDND